MGPLEDKVYSPGSVHPLSYSDASRRGRESQLCSSLLLLLEKSHRDREIAVVLSLSNLRFLLFEDCC